MATNSDNWTPERRARTVDVDELRNYPGKRVKGCNCGTWDHIHEPNCGWDVDDEGR